MLGFNSCTTDLRQDQFFILLFIGNTLLLFQRWINERVGLYTFIEVHLVKHYYTRMLNALCDPENVTKKIVLVHENPRVTDP